MFCVMQYTLVRADGMADCGQHVWSLWLLLVPLRAFFYLIISMHALLFPRMSYGDADSDSWLRRAVRRFTGMESVHLVRRSRLRHSRVRPPPRLRGYRCTIRACAHAGVGCCIRHHIRR